MIFKHMSNIFLDFFNFFYKCDLYAIISKYFCSIRLVLIKNRCDLKS